MAYLFCTLLLINIIYRYLLNVIGIEIHICVVYNNCTLYIIQLISGKYQNKIIRNV